MFAFMIPFYFVWRAARKRYQKIRDIHGISLPAEMNYLVTYASQDHFQKPRYLAYEGIGWLQLEENSVLFEGETVEGSRLLVQFHRGKARARWIGRCLRTGIAAWFVIEQEGQAHYFTSDALLRGPLALGTFKSSAKKIYEEVGKVLPEGASLMI